MALMTTMSITLHLTNTLPALHISPIAPFVSLFCFPPILFTTRYIFPRQLLIPQFWTPQQQAVFQVVYHSHRAQHYGAVLQTLKMAGSNTKDGLLQRSLEDLCSKVGE